MARGVTTDAEGSGPRAGSRSVRFWTHDLEPLDGWLRAVFYAGLLLLALNGTFRSPLAAPEVFAGTDPAFYTPRGLLARIGVGWVDAELLRAVRAVTVAAWCAAIAGLLQPLSFAVTGIGFMLLHGVGVGAVGITHRWYLAAWTLLALSFAVDDGRLSLDAWIARRFPRWPLLHPPALWRTGWARKVVLLVAVSVLFSGGVAKLLGSGPAWLDGLSLQHYIARHDDPRWPALATWLAERQWACAALSVFSVALELAAPLALVSRRARHALIVAALAFHLGIWLVMHPEYWAHSWCYLLLVDWRRLHAAVRPGATRAQAATSPAGSGPSLSAGAWAGTAVAAVLAAVSLARIEWWPFTHVPMYADYRGPAGAWSFDHLRDEAQARELAWSCHREHQCSWASAWFRVYLVEPDGTWTTLTRVVRYGAGRPGVLSKQLFRTLREVVSADVVARGDGPLGHDPSRPDLPAAAWLRSLVPGIRRAVPDWRRWERVAIVANLETGAIVIAEAALDAGDAQRSGRLSAPGSGPVRTARAGAGPSAQLDPAPPAPAPAGGSP